MIKTGSPGFISGDLENISLNGGKNFTEVMDGVVKMQESTGSTYDPFG